MKRGSLIAVSSIVALGLVVLFGWLSSVGQIDVLEPAGLVADEQKRLLIFTLALSALVVLPVFTLLAVFAIRYRSGAKPGRKYDPEWAENKWLEGLWWGIPIVIIGVLAVVTFQTSHSLDPRQRIAGNDPMRVQVIALQWKWLFLYPDQGVATLNHLPLQVDRPVTFSLTADAPMSAFWIPALGSQTYAMNGMASTLNLKATKTGKFTGYTTNINGKGYADMKFTAHVMSDREYNDWKAAALKSTKEMNMDEYHSLIPAKTVTAEQTYRLSNPSLFGDIIEMSAHGSAHHAEETIE